MAYMKTLLTLLVTMLTLDAAAQTDYTYGFFSIKDTALHIATEYYAASIFSDGLAAVKKEGIWGFNNADNERVIDFQYDYARGVLADREYGQLGDFYGVVNSV